MPDRRAKPTAPPPAPTARLETPGTAVITYAIVPPNEVAVPPLYLTMIGLVPCVIFAQAGLPQHQVNTAAARPVCVIHAPFLNWWNAAGAKLITIVPPSGVVGTASGPVILKLVASW